MMLILEITLTILIHSANILFLRLEIYACGIYVISAKAFFFFPPQMEAIQKKIRFSAPDESSDFARGKCVSTLCYGRYNGAVYKKCIFAFSAVRDYHEERESLLSLPPDFGKKPSSVSRGENRSGRWSNRASTTLPTGYFPAPEIRRTVPKRWTPGDSSFLLLSRSFRGAL